MQIASTALFDYPTVSLLVDFLVAEPEQSSSVDRQVVRSGSSEGNLTRAIVGVAQRLPKPLHSSLGMDTTSRISLDVWNPNAFTNDLDPRFANFLPNVCLFDAEIFQLSASESMLMDPQHRLLVMATRKT